MNMLNVTLVGLMFFGVSWIGLFVLYRIKEKTRKGVENRNALS
jgi:hypothetical protein